MKYKVIFDTNFIRNAESALDFLGGRNDLERFSKVSEIIIPDIVIEEIKAQKRKHLISKRDSFLSNPFHFLRKIDIKETENFNIDEWILELVKNEKISYTSISLTENGILEKIKNMCLECTPPFEDGSDKGFKDAYIYFTILEYLTICKDRNIFLVTRDERLRTAFLRESRIKVIKGYDEFENYIDEYFKEPYFVSRLKEEIDEGIEQNHIEDIWLNLEENWVLKIVCNEKHYFLEVDFTSKEILRSVNFDFSELINKLITSGSFSATHEAVESLKDCTSFLTDENVQSLIEASVRNEQIYWIANDDDIKEFFGQLYQAKQQIIPEDIKELFNKYFKTI